MKKNINYILLFLAAASISIGSCKKIDYKFGQIKTPSTPVITPTILGSAANATGDGSGKIKLALSATNALAYKVYWGDGDSSVISTDTTSHSYIKLDTNLYTITVNAIGTGGAMSTAAKQIKVLYLFQIPANVMTMITNNSTKKWMSAKETAGNFGVGPLKSFTPDYYSAGAEQEPSCAYDDVITFTQTGLNGISINVNNQGSSFLIGASTAFYGQSGPDGCYVINTGGTKALSFYGANTGSSASNSTGIEFSVPGNGIVDFGTGAVSYEILSITSTTIHLRDVGIDGNAWYQILQAQ
ncbi:MAG: hypothetical protein ACHQF4_03355 [Sphingobacteriales bacterium]